MTRKLYIETVGCQMNVLDSELVVGSLRRQGFELTNEAHRADVILFNTCSVRQHAEDKIYSQLGRLRLLNAATGRPYVRPDEAEQRIRTLEEELSRLRARQQRQTRRGGKNGRRKKK